jgi:hypothetical protein
MYINPFQFRVSRNRATATRDLIGPDGAVVPAPSLHAASLAALADLFAVVVSRADDIPS